MVSTTQLKNGFFERKEEIEISTKLTIFGVFNEIFTIF